MDVLTGHAVEAFGEGGGTYFGVCQLVGDAGHADVQQLLPCGHLLVIVAQGHGGVRAGVRAVEVDLGQNCLGGPPQGHPLCPEVLLDADALEHRNGNGQSDHNEGNPEIKKRENGAGCSHVIGYPHTIRDGSNSWGAVDAAGNSVGNGRCTGGCDGEAVAASGSGEGVGGVGDPCPIVPRACTRVVTSSA